MKSTIKIIALSTLFFLIGPTPSMAVIDAEVLLEQGMESFQSENFGSSELVFRKIIDLDLDDNTLLDKARFYFCRALLAQKKYKAALFELNNFYNKCRTIELCVESRFWMAETYYHLKDYLNSIEEYKRYIALAKEGDLVITAYDRIGTIYYLLKRYDEAIIEWEKSISKSKDKNDNRERYYLVSQAYFSNKKYKEALANLDLLSTPKNSLLTAKSLLLKGRIAQINGEHKKALSFFNKIDKKWHQNKYIADYLYFKALSLLNLKQKKTSQKILQNFIDSSKNSSWLPAANYQLAKIYLEENQQKKAISLLEKISHHHYDQIESTYIVESNLLLAKIYFKNQPAKALTYLEGLTKFSQHQDYKEIIILLVETHLKLNNFVKANKNISSFVEKYPYYKNLDEITFLKAKIFLQQGEIEEASKLFEKIKRENPFSKCLKEINYNLAIISYHKKEYQKVIIKLNSYLKNKNIKSRDEAEILLLKSYLQLDRLFLLEKKLKEILKRSNFPDNLDKIILQYAFCLNKKNQITKAKKYFNILIKKFPFSDSTYRLYSFLGQESYKKKRYKKAEKYFKLYLKSDLSKGRGMIFFALLSIKYQNKEYQEIIDLLHKSPLPPLSEEQLKQIPIYLSKAYFQLGEYAKTYRMISNNIFYNNLKEYPPQILLLYVKSALYIERPQEARNTIKLFETEKNFYGQAIYALGDYYFTKNKFEEAIGLFSRVIIEGDSKKTIDQAKIKLAEIYLKKKRFKDALDKLAEIKNKNFKTTKVALSILVYFATGNHKKATSLTRKNFKSLSKNSYKDKVFQANLEYYYQQKNLKKFNHYAKYLIKNEAKKDFVLYRQAKIYLQKKSYKKSYSYFYKLFSRKNEYWPEAAYNLALINYYHKKKSALALKYLNQLSQDLEKTNPFKWKAKIILAKYWHKAKKKKKAKEYLLDIIKNCPQNESVNQADKLLKHYAY